MEARPRKLYLNRIISFEEYSNSISSKRLSKNMKSTSSLYSEKPKILTVEASMMRTPISRTSGNLWVCVSDWNSLKQTKRWRNNRGFNNLLRIDKGRTNYMLSLST